MGTMPLRGVIFDADGVLQHPDPGSIGPWTEAQHRAFATRLYGSWLSSDDMLDATRIEARCDALLREMAWPGDPAAYLMLWAARAVVPDPAMMDEIARLRGLGVACYLGTNQDAYWARHMETVLGYGGLFDGLFFSCRLGAAKPQSAYFEAMLAAIPHPRESLVFFDDKAANVEAALACGLPARVFTDMASYQRDMAVLGA